MEKNRTLRIGPPFGRLLNFILKLLFSWMEVLSFNNSLHLKKNSLHKSKHLQPWAPISCLTMNHQSHFQGVGYQKKREVFISKRIYSCLWWVKWYHIFEKNIIVFDIFKSFGCLSIQNKNTYTNISNENYSNKHKSRVENDMVVI